MRKATKRSLQMSLYIVGGFLVCWIPYYTLYISLLFGLAPQEVGQLSRVTGHLCIGILITQH